MKDICELCDNIDIRRHKYAQMKAYHISHKAASTEAYVMCKEMSSYGFTQHYPDYYRIHYTNLHKKNYDMYSCEFNRVIVSAHKNKKRKDTCYKHEDSSIIWHNNPSNITKLVKN